ncbi:MAG: TSUP family transporter [Saprospiraceae bacterium]|nr:TSUP family transporter [Saprospiraceae bacterium]
MTTLGLVLISVVAFLAAILTFFSGFGLGTLLLPVFLLFFPVEVAIAMTGIVHLANNLFKTSLVGHFASRQVVLAFGVPALLGAWIGALLLGQLSGLSSLGEYTLGDTSWQISPVKLIVAVLMIGFAILELLPDDKQPVFSKGVLPFGGLLSGFFGGLSGHQGALRSAFLIRLGLSKETFIASGILIAMGIDVVRLLTYGTSGWIELASREWPALTIGIVSAIAGALIGRQWLRKVKLIHVQRIVAITILLMAIALGLGWV